MGLLTADRNRAIYRTAFSSVRPMLVPWGRSADGHPIAALCLGLVERLVRRMDHLGGRVVGGLSRGRGHPHAGRDLDRVVSDLELELANLLADALAEDLRVPQRGAASDDDELL